MKSQMRVLTNINEDVVLKKLFTDAQTRSKTYAKQAHFLLNKLEAIKDEADEISRDHWKKVAEQLKARGLISQDYDNDKETLHFDEETGNISISPNVAAMAMKAAKEFAKTLGIDLDIEKAETPSKNDTPVVFESVPTIH